MLKRLGFQTFVVLCTSLFVSDISAAQQTEGAKPIQSKYHGTVFKAAMPRYKFGDFEIKITQSAIEKSELKKSGTCDSSFPPQIKVEKNGLIVDQFTVIHPETTTYVDLYVTSLFVPMPQPLSNYFLILTHGGKDVRLLIIDSTGHINDIDGGGYFISDEKRYLFSNWGSRWEEPMTDSGFTVYDLRNNRVVYKTGKKDCTRFDGVDQWYKDGADYFFTAQTPYAFNGQSWIKEKDNYIFVYKFTNNTLLREPIKDRLKKAKKIQLNSVDD